MTCAELEILLCDYVDGTLHAQERTALESHLSGCPACTQLAQDVQGMTAFMERVAEVDPPAELMTRILHYAPTGRRASAEERASVSPPGPSGCSADSSSCCSRAT
jgi:anti-sigma factor RsiW